MVAAVSEVSMNIELVKLAAVCSIVGLAGLTPLYVGIRSLWTGEAWVRMKYLDGRRVQRDVAPLTYWLRVAFLIAMGAIFGIGGIAMALILLLQL